MRALVEIPWAYSARHLRVESIENLKTLRTVRRFKRDINTNITKERKRTMPVHTTGRGGQAIAPCSHCNANDQGPEAGICHRNLTGNGDSCWDCTTATHGNLGLLKGSIMSGVGALKRTPCSYCGGKGYTRI